MKENERLLKMWKTKTVEWIDVELTSFCNIACPGCLRQEKRKQVDHILDKINQVGYEALSKEEKDALYTSSQKLYHNREKD